MQKILCLRGFRIRIQKIQFWIRILKRKTYLNFEYISVSYRKKIECLDKYRLELLYILKYVFDFETALIHGFKWEVYASADLNIAILITLRKKTSAISSKKRCRNNLLIVTVQSHSLWMLFRKLAIFRYGTEMVSGTFEKELKVGHLEIGHRDTQTEPSETDQFTNSLHLRKFIRSNLLVYT